jgi:hypothetical protein
MLHSTSEIAGSAEYAFGLEEATEATRVIHPVLEEPANDLHESIQADEIFSNAKE